MRKSLLIILSLIFVLTACGTANNQNKTASENKETDIKQEAIKEIGNGTFYLENESGTTENENVITIFDDGQTQIMQIGIVTSDIDGSKLSYIYIDGKLNTKLQISDSQDSLDLTKEDLTVGKHQVVLKQFDNNKEDGTPITVKVAQYEVANK